MDTMQHDVVVVGAGLAGLAAGALVARTGASVVVLDGHEPGGRARTTVYEGFRLNLGAHALYEAGAAKRVLGGLGIDPPGHSPNVSGRGLWIGGGRHVLPTGPATLVRTGAMGLRAKVAFGRALAAAPRTDATSLAHLCFDEFLDSRRLPADARSLVRMLARTATYTEGLDRLSADAAVRQMQLALQGVRYLDGGWQQLVGALEHALAGAGGSLRSGAAVRALTQDGGDWVVEVGDEEVRATSVVLAVGSPTATAALLPAAIGEPFGAAGPLGPDVEASCLDVGVDVDAQPGLLFSADEPWYLSPHSPPADLAPAGQALVSLIRYLAPGEALPAETTRRELWTHAARAGITPDSATMHRYLHRMKVMHAMPTPERGGLAGRPPVAVPGTGGLFVAGDWVGPEGLLADASFASAATAARLATAGRDTTRRVPTSRSTAPAPNPVGA